MFYNKKTIFNTFYASLTWLRLSFVRISIALIITILICMIAQVLSNNFYSSPPGVEPMTFEEPMEELVIEGNNQPIFFEELEYQVIYDSDLARRYLTTLENSFVVLDYAIISGEYSSLAVAAMKDEYDRLQVIYSQIQQDLNRSLAWESEYYYAAKTYAFLKQSGYNDAVVCGIIGNMMIETAGGTLNLQPTAYNSSGNYYGLCQWDLRYYPQYKGASFEQQLEYLVESMPYEFNTFGKLYKKSFTYDDFLEITDPAQAAYIFAKVYERCSSAGYTARKTAAIKAYEYFVFD